MFTFDEDCVSDLHKDAFGFRPSQSWWYGWTHATDAQKQYEWDHLLECLDQENARKTAYENEMITKFEASLLTIIESGAKDRETAIRWLVDAADLRDDMEHFAFRNGLPYQYFKKA